MFGPPAALVGGDGQLKAFPRVHLLEQVADVGVGGEAE